MFVNNNATVVEKSTRFPINFILPSNMLGRTDNWGITLVNKMDGSISELADFEVKEIGEFVNRSIVKGDYQAGAMTVRVEDSSLFSKGQLVRIYNHTYRIVEINLGSHLLVFDSPLMCDVADQAPVQVVLHPQLLGMYTIDKVEISSVGNFLLVIYDKNNEVANITAEVVVVSSLQQPLVGGKVQASVISSNTIG